MSKVLLILGAGANVGLSTTKKFISSGWKVAAVSRSEKPDIKSVATATFTADFSDPNSVLSVFEKVTSELGPPSAVIYNAPGATFADPKDPLAVAPADFTKDTQINLSSLYAAAHAAVKGFAAAPAGPKSFAFTGNVLNHKTSLVLLSLGVGKAGAAHFIEAVNGAYKEKDYRFYYVDERTEAGAPVLQKINGEAHGKVFYELATEEKGRDWEIHFYKGEDGGITYKNFGTVIG